jgi:hypothetical protein
MSQDQAVPSRRRSLLRYFSIALVLLAIVGAGGYWWVDTAYERAITQAIVKHGLSADYGRTPSQQWPRGLYVRHVERARTPAEAEFVVFVIPEARGVEFRLDEDSAGWPRIHQVFDLDLRMGPQKWRHQLVASYTAAAPPAVVGGRDLDVPGKRVTREQALAAFDSVVVLRERWRTQNADSLARMVEWLTQVSGPLAESIDPDRETMVLSDERSFLPVFEQIPVQFGEAGAAALARCIADARPSGARVEKAGAAPIVLPVGYLCFYILKKRTGFVQEPERGDDSAWTGEIDMHSKAPALRAARDAWLRELEKGNLYFVGDFKPHTFF